MARKILCVLLVSISALVFLLLPLKSDHILSARSVEGDSIPSGEFAVDDLVLSEHGLTFSLAGGEIRIDHENQLVAPGLNGRTQEPGAPSLPFYSTWIVLPPGAGIDITVDQPNWLSSEISEITPVVRAKFPGSAIPGLLEAPAVSEISLINGQEPSAYEQDTFYPHDLIEYSEPMYVRDIRLVKLSIYPIRFNPIQKHLVRADSVHVDIAFLDIDPSVSEVAPSYEDVHGDALSGQVLNWDQAVSWRGLPEPEQTSSTQLPIGVDVYRIEVDSDAIYKIYYSDLQAAGMDVDNTDPNTFEMLYRGQSVSFRFAGNDDASFQPGEYIYFYGWEFNGSRLEKQFITRNIFWLWAGGTSSYIDVVDSIPGQQVDSFTATVTREPENVWFPTWTDQWEYFPNEPDAWYWERYTKTGVTPLTKTYEITLPNPMAAGREAIVTAEFSSKNTPRQEGNPIPHIVHVYFNNDSNYGTGEWIGIKNVNVTTTVPITLLNPGINQIDVVLATNSAVGAGTEVYLNRLSVEYRQELAAVNDQLAFSSDIGGAREFSIGGFSNGSPSDVIIWDISDELAPVSIISDSISITGTGPYTYTFGTDQFPGSEFIITTLSNGESPIGIEQLVLENIEPQSPGADWVAISYGDFIIEVERLAAHRTATFFGSMNTHVVDIASIVNQYGYGLPLPSAIQDYLIHALTTWEQPPSYLLLVGDSTINPRGNLHKGNPFWAPQLVPTDLVFVDRFQGQIPSDHIYSLLIGNDLLPDLAVGRIPVKTGEELSAVVDKIIIYEHNQLLPADWMENILFLSDDYDSSAGDFCFENQQVGYHLPDIFAKIELCLPDNPSEDDAANLRTQFYTYTNQIGVSIVNYRGHGGLNFWGGDPRILTTSNVDDWDNPAKPVIILSGDCLDGFFAYPTTEGLAETFLRADEGGSAAHWSSSGLGYSNEHSELVEALYDGLFLSGLTAIGDAANYAKVQFYQEGGHRSLLYSFILEGDPAMQMMRPALSIDKSTATSWAQQGDIIDYFIDISNSGIYPSHVVVTDTLPSGLSFITMTSSLSATIMVAGNDIIFDLQFGEEARNKGLPRDATASITLTVEVDLVSVGGVLSNLAQVSGSGQEAWPGNESDSVSVCVYCALIPKLFKE
ncbi:MAG: C25 family cysteine peptidase [Candidatus Promineifilaceae bacterium]